MVTKGYTPEQSIIQGLYCLADAPASRHVIFAIMA